MSNTLTDWLGAAGRNLTEAVTLYHPEVFTDGQVTQWRTAGAEALAVRHECEETAEGDLPRSAVKLTFLLPETPQVSPGDEIEYRGVRYRIQAVQRSRSLTGRVVAQRCSIE